MKNRKNNGGDSPPFTSLRTLYGILFFLLMTGTIILGYLINSIFLERYYVSDRKKALVRVYDQLQAAAAEDRLGSEEFDQTLQKSLRRSNVSLLILDSNTNTDKVWSADESVMQERLYANLFGMTPIMPRGEKKADWEDGSQPPPSGEEDGPVAAEEEDDYYSEYVITQILEEEKPYTINVVLNRYMGTRSMEMWGPLGESRFFLLRSPLEDIRSSAAAANRFYGYIGFILAVAGTILAWWLSRRITEPVRQLTDISVRMKHLDFSAKYEGQSRTEIDILGKNMNEMSQKLEETISALRTANNELQRDLDRRNRQEEMRQEFLANVTHELKTPIALVQGYAEGLQDGIADDPESRDFYLSTIVEESKKMDTIVQKVLMLNQLEFGDSSVNMERFDIVGMIRNYLESASLLARQDNITLQFDEKGPVYVWGDPFLIQEVFANYYSNALHHVCPPGKKDPAQKAGPEEGQGTGQAAGPDEKVIDIRCDSRDNCVRVTVFNTGNPIPESALPHIWEKFYKVDKARTRAYGGSGVGLSIVKAIMDLHHRNYGAENYDNGVAFWFELDRSGGDK